MKRYNYKAKAIAFDEEGMPTLTLTMDGVVKAENKEEAETKVRKHTFKARSMYVVSVSTRVAKG